MNQEPLTHEKYIAIITTGIIEHHGEFLGSYIRRKLNAEIENGSTAVEFFKRMYEAEQELIFKIKLPKHTVGIEGKYLDINGTRINLYDLFLFNKAVDSVKKNIEKLDQPEIKQKVTAPSIALFCAIVNDSKELIKGSDENKKDYCKRVCEAYKLPYSDNVRQKFLDGPPEIKKKDKNYKSVIALIIPALTGQQRKSIDTYLNSKTNLYN